MEKTIPKDISIILDYLQAQEQLAYSTRLQILTIYNPEEKNLQTKQQAKQPKPTTQKCNSKFSVA
jgi:hypothetical protein